MEEQDLNSVTANITARVPYPIKIRIQERAMRYKMNLNEYMNVMIGAISRNEDLMNPDKIQKMVSSVDRVKELEKELKDSESALEVLKMISQASVEEVEGRLKEKEKELKAANSRLKALEAELKAADKEYQEDLSEADKRALKAFNELREVQKQNSEYGARINELQSRLNKANKYLKDKASGFLGDKLVQF